MATPTFKSESILEKRWKNFKKIKRGYYALIIIGFLYLLSFFFPLLINSKALVVKHQGNFYFPAFQEMVGQLFPTSYRDATFFGQTQLFGEPYSGPPNFRMLKKQYAEANQGDWVLMPPYDYDPVENVLKELPKEVSPPTPPDKTHFFGTDNSGRDVFARLMYGFRISISFALIVSALSYLIGIMVGALLGYYGGKIDIFGMRFIEIFSNIPFLFMVMIIGSFLKPSFYLLASLLVVLGGWIGISLYIRGEFFREKARDYVAAAKAMGASDWRIMFKHILPNSLVPVITFLPFAIVGEIFALVSLDFLGFGLQPPTPSWGELFSQGREDIFKWWLIVVPFFAMCLTLISITFIGEALRQAFDPRDYSRLK